MKLFAKKSLVDQMVEAIDDMCLQNKAPDHFELSEDEAVALYDQTRHEYSSRWFRPDRIVTRGDKIKAVNNSAFMGVLVKVIKGDV